MGHDTFILLCNNTIVDSNIDMNYHARTSKDVGAVPLKRLVNTPYHYTDGAVGKKPNDSLDLDFSSLAIHRIATFGQNKHRGEVSNGKDEKQFAGNGKSHFILQFMS